MMELINQLYEIVWLKNTGLFKEETRTPRKLKIEKTSCHQERKKLEQFLKISVPEDMTTRKRDVFHQKVP